MEQTPKGNRVHIGFFGRCNAGKSTLINMLADQPVSIVSEVSGTTTDPVSKSIEILPLGPVVITDTAGIDDVSELGGLRVEKTEELIKKINLAVYVLRSDREPTAEDMHWLGLLGRNNVPIAVFVNDYAGYAGDKYIASHDALAAAATVIAHTDFSSGRDRILLLDLLGGLTPLDAEGDRALLKGLVDPGDMIVLVCPIDGAAPKGRLILPQVQTVREILDNRGLASVCQPEELPGMLSSLAKPPKLVITDSQAFDTVNAMTPREIPLTSFSILMARYKGKLQDLVTGVRAVRNLKPGSRVLISEGCTHRRQCDDIGTVKIPMWLEKQGYRDLRLEFTSGGAFPRDVSGYDLIIHCGACMLTRREVLRRIDCAVVQGTPIVNYGVLIASLHGILERAVSPFRNELA